MIDDFFQKFEAIYWQFLKYSNKRLRMCSSQLKVSEIVFIAISEMLYNSKLRHDCNGQHSLFDYEKAHQRWLYVSKILVGMQEKNLKYHRDLSKLDHTIIYNLSAFLSRPV